MEGKKKKARYNRIYIQIKELLEGHLDPVSRMATIVAVLHHKMEYFFWTGFYTLQKGELIVGPYQGPVACILLKINTGVCWAGINRKETILVPDVHDFPGHIACDSRSRSEIVVPLIDQSLSIKGVLDVDSTKLNAFDDTDKEALERIVHLVYHN
ncbi:GAF domain-containing protein [candidate division KSB1 bacterium]